MSVLDRLVTLSIPMVPKPIVRRISARYIAGETLDDAIRVVTELNRSGAMATLDVLGEDVFERKQCTETVDDYLRVLDAIVAKKLDCNISIKATAFGLKLDPAFCHENIERLLRAAHERGIFVRIDMEDSGHLEATLDVFRAVRATHDNVGIVIQSYLFRSEQDIRDLLALGSRIRLCKGAYKEPPEVAFQAKSKVDANYVDLMKILLPSGIYHGIATHDPAMINATIRFARDQKLDQKCFEFQMLYGIARDRQLKLVEEGFNVRVYVPFGRAWYPYFMRRLAERPANVLFILRAMVKG